jgi:hypothetical protein
MTAGSFRVKAEDHRAQGSVGPTCRHEDPQPSLVLLEGTRNDDRPKPVRDSLV